MRPKTVVRDLLPKPLFNFYHWFLAKLAAVFYGFPSKQMIVIGITGTLGKSTTVQFLGQMLEGLGQKVGWASTIGFKVGEKEWINDKKMTMLGRFQTQKLLRQMVAAGCRYAIIEVSSQGVGQFRHVGINFDVAVLTNLSPEHIEAHGGFENYKKTKGKFFAFVAKSRLKKINKQKIFKSFVVNIDNEHAPYFLGLIGGRKGKERIIKFGVERQTIKILSNGSDFVWRGLSVHINPFGLHNVYNAIAAAEVLRALNFSSAEVAGALSKIKFVSGRMEIINERQNFSLIVDFAYEPKSVLALYETVKILPHQKIIHVLGSCGGGRDAARRPLLGKLAAENADLIIVTNEDPYDDDPKKIIDEVAAGAIAAGKVEGKNLWRFLDRQEAITKAVFLAGPNDLVLITGKGSEPVMAVASGRLIPWDDRVAAREAIKQKNQTRKKQYDY